MEPAELASRLTARSSSGIAAQISTLIEDGTLVAGTRLPTIRSLAKELGVSPTTVTESWNHLLLAGVIRTEGRRGTFVAPRAGKHTIETALGSLVYDVAQGEADPGLFPPLDRALLAAAGSPGIHRNDFAYITDNLRDALAPSWPYRPSAWTTADGGKHASFLAIRALTRRGRPVAIEQPTLQRVLALLRDRRCPLLGVEWDESGPLPEQLERAIGRGAEVFIMQPRAHFPTGRTVSPQRLEELAEVLSVHPQVTVIEDDVFGPLARTPALSLGRFLPDRVVHIRNFDAAYGLDLRTSVVTGSIQNIRAINLERGMFGVWNSRILQEALTYLLVDPQSDSIVRRAAKTYAHRRKSLSEAIEHRGVPTTGGDGFVLWLAVPEEEAALQALTHWSVIAGLGSVCWIESSDRRHIRVPVTAQVEHRGEREHLAGLLAGAARGELRAASR